MRAIEVMNAPAWASYSKRRDEILGQCKTKRTRHDSSYWQNDLNGAILSMEALAGRAGSLAPAMPLWPEVNEAWFLHGTSHVAAEGITTEDFDMTRANPAGLFGAGLYFAESVSKSDEYVEGKVIGGTEMFPLLICRVCLGHVRYCGERHPDRRDLERKCLSNEFHSVLGDRKKTSGTFREFIIYDNLQVFPAYILYYTRQY